MKVLVLGGTAFLGRHLVDRVIARGHAATVFNRGRHPATRRDVEWLHGDRSADLSALRGGRWDAVIDTSGYVPSQVRASAALLADKVAHYTFVSTLSVYASSSEGPIDESGTLEQVPADKLAGLEAIVPEVASPLSTTGPCTAD